MSATTGNRINSPHNAQLMMNNLLFGGEAWAGMHESRIGTTRNRTRTKRAWDAYLLKHPLGIMFATRIIPLGVEMYFTPFGLEVLAATGMTQSVREMQVHPGPQQYVKELLFHELKRRNIV